MDILHHILGNPENTKCLFFFWRLCQRGSFKDSFCVQLSQPPFSKVSKSTAPSKRSAYHTAPLCLQSHGNGGMPSLGCRNSTGISNQPLEVVVAKYGLPCTGQHSTRNQHRKGEESMALPHAKQAWYWQNQLSGIQNHQDPLNTHVFWLDILKALSVRKW